MDETKLTLDQLFVLNDALTAVLARLGWTSQSQEDDEKLNDTVLSIADVFFPEAKA